MALTAAPGATERVENPAARAKLPEFQIIPAAAADETTATNGLPVAESMRTWMVSHGDAGTRRYSALTQINRRNVRQLREAWTYHSKDGQGNIQSNPIVVNGVMYALTVGRAIVAVDAVKGTEIWRFQLETPKQMGLDEAPARRGLVYCPGNGLRRPRIVFACGKWVYALDPQTGKPLPEFGQNGRTPLATGGTAVEVIWQDTYILPGSSGDIYASASPP